MQVPSSQERASNNFERTLLEEAQLIKLSRCFERQKRGKISLSERKKNRNI